MKSRLIVASVLVVAGCGQGTEEATVPATQVKVAPQITKYDAKTFFESTSYNLARSYAWSHDDSALLLSSDLNGTFNLYSMDPASGEMIPLTD